MLPQINRLTLRGLTPPFTTWKKSHRVPGLILYFRKARPTPAEVMQLAQGAVVVSKKTLPLAVQRNRVKRQLRAMLSSTLLHLPPNTQVVVLVRAREWDASQLVKTLQSVC